MNELRPTDGLPDASRTQAFLRLYQANERRIYGFILFMDLRMVVKSIVAGGGGYLASDITLRPASAAAVMAPSRSLPPYSLSITSRATVSHFGSLLVATLKYKSARVLSPFAPRGKNEK